MKAGLVAFLVAIRIACLLAAVSAIPADGQGAFGNDARRFLEIARSPGTPYRDVQIEVPPVSVGIFHLLAVDVGDVRQFAWRLAWLMLACDLATALVLRWGWSGGVAIAYLLIGTPVAYFAYVRADLLSIFLAAAGVALAYRQRWSAGGLAIVAGAFTKVWPVLLVPLFVARRKWRSAVVALAGGLVGLLAWVLAFGADGVRQVLTFRGASGWGVESTWGSIEWLILDRPIRFESGAWRVGQMPAAMPALLAVLLTAGSAYLWARATERTAFGAVPTAVIALLLLLSPHTSLQWVMWCFPFVAISRDLRTCVWACVAGVSASAVYVAATVPGASPFAVGG